MSRRRFLSTTNPKELVLLALDGTPEHRVASRVNALLLLDDGWNCELVAKDLSVDDANGTGGLPRSTPGALPLRKSEGRCPPEKPSRSRKTGRGVVGAGPSGRRHEHGRERPGI